MDKEDIRSRIKARKSLLSQAEKAYAAKNVFDRLEQSAAFLLAENVLLYILCPMSSAPASFWRNGRDANISSYRESTG